MLSFISSHQTEFFIVKDQFLSVDNKLPLSLFTCYTNLFSNSELNTNAFLRNNHIIHTQGFPIYPNTLTFIFRSNHNALPSPRHHINKSEVLMSFLECISQRNSYLLAICYSDTRINWMPMQMCSTPLTETSVTHRHTIWFIIPVTKWTLWLYTMFPFNVFI